MDITSIDKLSQYGAELTDELLANVPESADNQTIWLHETGRQLHGWVTLTSFSLLQQCKILYHVHKVWVRENALTLTATGPWDNDFMKWAKANTQTRNAIDPNTGEIVEPATSTISNKIGVYRDLFAERTFTLPTTIEIPKRTDTGLIIEGDMIEIAPDFSQCDFTKLLTAKGRILRDEMTDQDWSVLFDPYATVDELIEVFGGPKGSGAGMSSSDFRVFFDNGWLCAYEGGMVEQLFVMNDTTNSELWRKGIGFVLGSMGIKELPAEVI